MDINYEALDTMVSRLEDGGTFSLDEVRSVFGSVVDDAIESERMAITESTIEVPLSV